MVFFLWLLTRRETTHVCELQQERPVLNLAYGEMQCTITLEIVFAILEFVKRFVKNFYN